MSALNETSLFRENPQSKVVVDVRGNPWIKVEVCEVMEIELESPLSVKSARY